jgi:cholesterol transport system auxiliary component
MKLLFIVFSTLFLLTGCSLFSPVKGPENTYVLNAIAHPQARDKSSITLLVSPVSSDPTYNTTQIAYTNKPYQIAYFSKNVWAQTPAIMLQPLIVQSLQNTNYFHAITTGSGQYDYALTTQLIELKQDFLYAPSVVRLKLRVQLISAANMHIIATKQISVVTVAPQRTPLGGVIAANQATSDMLYQLTQFCLNALGR